MVRSSTPMVNIRMSGSSLAARKTGGSRLARWFIWAHTLAIYRYSRKTLTKAYCCKQTIVCGRSRMIEWKAQCLKECKWFRFETSIMSKMRVHMPVHLFSAFQPGAKVPYLTLLQGRDQGQGS